MNMLLDLIKSDYFLLIILITNIILLILYLLNVVKLNKIRKNYTIFINKLGNGTNLEEVLRKYINKVEEVDNKNNEIMNYCTNIDKNMQKCIQKIGIVRYNAFQDTGSNLSFALALLDEENTGVVLNGIYSREMSNIYGKPVIKGKSEYTLSEEENAAISNAIGNL